MQLKHIILAALSSVAFVHLPAQAAGLTQYQAKAGIMQLPNTR